MMGINDEGSTKALHALLVMMLTVMSWLIVQLYGNLSSSVGAIDERFESYTVRSTEQTRGADEKLAQYMLLVEKRLAALTVRVDYLEEEVSTK